MGYISILFLMTSLFLYSREACIIVHGTWASKASWYRPGGDFFDAISESMCKRGVCQELISFSWSGKNSDVARYQAGIRLAELIDGYDRVTVVAHSHGATVGIIASHILHEQFTFYGGGAGYKIKSFYALGVPVNKYEHFPNMNVVQYFYNLFSFADIVQPVFGIFGRTFVAHDRVANFSVSIDSREPCHSGIHGKLMGKALLGINENMRYCPCPKTTCGCKRNIQFSFLEPGIIYVNFFGRASYKVDHKREQLIARDQKLTRLLLDAIVRKRKRRQL